ncbi:hypothetical protein [Chryseolinea soli]|uniref:hypothetical protein n=1 Tax=Chryseolinea soli TaxID=2321403 RepID=UPI00135A5983|nr:hypothetical protein [Chryseolinea soli]
MINNQVPYLEVQTKNKVGRAFLSQANVPVTIYLNNDSDAESLMGKVVTNEKGIASLGLPATLAARWKEKSNPTFFAHTDSSANFNAAHEELSMNKSRLELDTANEDGTRIVKARLFKYEKDLRVPIAGVDVRLAVKRLGGYLKIGEEESYTTDSTGTAQGEFNRADLPGDALGNLEVAALVDDHDEVGTLETRMEVPWGVPPKVANNFQERSLYATGNKAPIWLMVMAYGCIAGVWMVIIYLIAKIVQMKRVARNIS